MLAGKVARRYARALVMLGEENRLHTQIAADLKRFGDVLAKQAGLRRLLTDPSVERKARLQILETLLTDLKLHRLVHNFLCLLLAKQRFEHLSVIVQQYELQLDRLAGRVRAQVITAVRLNAEARTKLQTALQKLTGRQVIVETSVDQAILAGVVTKVGHVVLDGSLRTQMQRLRQALTRAN